MFDWMKRGGSSAHPHQGRAEPAKPAGRAMSGRYLLLYKYLENRYANMVVLTFAEIEDLLGFELPDQARLRQEWWTDKETAGADHNHSDSWMLASRTARPNMLAKTVAFERAA